MSLQTFSLTLKETYMITPTVRHFTFVRTDGGLFPFTPGQFITIHFEYEGQSLRRSYSVATIPLKNETIEFAASYVKDGPGSEFLFHLKEGETLQASGPFGRLILRDESPSRYILVATGTGVTPYRAMLPQIHQRLESQPLLEVILLLGVRTQEELLYGEDFVDFANTNPRFHFVPHYSRELKENLKPFERCGYVQTVFDELTLNPQQDIIYLCGNPNMIDEAFSQLRTLGFDTHTIRREKYISPNVKSTTLSH